MHVAVGGEGLAAHRAFVWPLTAVHQHVAIQRAGRAQALSTDTARVIRSSSISVMLKRERETERKKEQCLIILTNVVESRM